MNILSWFFFYISNIIGFFFFKLKFLNKLILKINIIFVLLPYEFLIILSFFLIIIGIWSSCINKNNLFKIILSLELIYLGISFLFILIGLINLDLKCFIITLLIFSAGAAETVLVLSLLICLFTFNRSINISSLNNLL